MWVKLHDSTPDDPDLDRLTDSAFRAYVSAICYCQRVQTDGVITAAQVARTVPSWDGSILAELTANPLAHADGPLFAESSPGIYVIRNFTKYQGSSAGWAAKRAAEAERKAKWREGKEAS